MMCYPRMTKIFHDKKYKYRLCLYFSLKRNPESIHRFRIKNSSFEVDTHRSLKLNACFFDMVAYCDFKTFLLMTSASSNVLLFSCSLFLMSPYLFS